MSDPRPSISVVVPFYGDADDARALAQSLAGLRRRDEDEVIVADNTEDGRFAAAADLVQAAGILAVPAPLERSSYYARNVGVEHSSAEWLLFVDSDCRVPPTLLDDYFPEPVADDVGIVSGAVLGAPGQQGLVAAYATSRGHIDPSAYDREGHRPAGITANLLVRRAAWEVVAGFQEGIRSGADLEFCWRVQDAGWGFAWRLEAALHHEHVSSVGALRRKTIRHAGGGGWVNDRYPGSFARPQLPRQLARAVVGVGAWLVLLQPRRALYKGMDGVFLSFDAYGRLTGNRADRDAPSAPAGAGRALVAVTGSWPEPGDGTVAALLAAGHRVRVEADARPWRPDRAARRGIDAFFREEDGVLARLRDAAWLVVRRPLAVLADRRGRTAQDTPLRRLAPAVRRTAERGDEVVVAIGASRDAERVAALSGRPLDTGLVVPASAVSSAP